MPVPVHTSIPMGVVVRRAPGVTRWAKWCWKPVGVLPGAPKADWRELRRDGDTVEYHAATVTLTLWAAEAEAYMTALADRPPSIWVVMRATSMRDLPFEVALVTASPFEAQDYADSGEEMLEKLPMPPGLTAWVEDFTLRHYRKEEFVKRRRDKTRTDRIEDGRGDARIVQTTDVYRSPAGRRKVRVS